jgi:hypothetical protein
MIINLCPPPSNYLRHIHRQTYSFVQAFWKLAHFYISPWINLHWSNLAICCFEVMYIVFKQYFCLCCCWIFNGCLASGFVVMYWQQVLMWAWKYSFDVCGFVQVWVGVQWARSTRIGVQTSVVLILRKCQVWTHVYIQEWRTLPLGYRNDEFFWKPNCSF